jgi:hypothetical protein
VRERDRTHALAGGTAAGRVRGEGHQLSHVSQAAEKERIDLRGRPEPSERASLGAFHSATPATRVARADVACRVDPRRSARVTRLSVGQVFNGHVIARACTIRGMDHARLRAADVTKTARSSSARFRSDRPSAFPGLFVPLSRFLFLSRSSFLLPFFSLFLTDPPDASER